ncbi:flagellar FliL protein [Alkalithermobacter thermoalcaliphilus JW-YL-7 = DSM 7308]|uniref:Flagellar protein FliL n=1 Tax=Alkalithermobacter thermoalcaliphilus JW-YL-7 = DSM 7308 TaxID=1121328 RepID=A0A150FQD0_CLOPD|nr:flagellar basal body-associated protein FliL [[Clostridium] paradoxum JW-YL-7 = DSM 7308]SHK61037.1 flagellar FliL protein [[Clostridium] paradoxum JW-YL-7 = DSM 7308]
MNTKKVVIFSIVAFILSLGTLGAVLYFTVFNNHQNTEKNIKTYIYDAGEFSTNIGNNNNYFKGNITIETTDKNLPKKLAESNILLRDLVLRTIISQDPSEMVKTEGVEKFKMQLIKELSRLMNTESITNIYFTNYIVQ